MPETAELGVADVDVPEVRTRSGVVGPDLLLVLERALPGVRIDHDRPLPGALALHVGGRHVVGTRDREAQQPVEDLPRERDVTARRVPSTDEVGVIQA